jgi:hypothetical protein
VEIERMPELEDAEEPEPASPVGLD